MLRAWLLACAALLAAQGGVAAPVWQPLAYASAPVDNPLKGLVPYAGTARAADFPHSMEFSYFPLSAVLNGSGQYDWSELERFLDAVAARGHQAVFRFYVEYPGKTGSVPAYLIEKGLGITHWPRASTPPRPPVENATPDYANPLLRQALSDFIAALGARYDGDPRIAYITAGLLGLWGEWHDGPRNELFAGKSLQQEVMNAYSVAFHVTPILLRYPAGSSDARYVDNTHVPFGYHDDSFAWSTLPVKPHHFLALQKLAGADAQLRWQRYPIGGEIRPEAWGAVFDAERSNPAIEDFATCVEATHVTWLMDSGMFRAGNSPERLARAREQVRHMGYEFHVSAVALTQEGARLSVRLRIANLGVAPFYYAWPLRLALLDGHGQFAGRIAEAGDLRAILPQDTVLREAEWDMRELAPGRYRVLVQVANSLPRGQPVRFANLAQDADLPGWLSLGMVNWQ